MTFKQKHTENKKLIILYRDFMPYVDSPSDLLKLSMEIVILLEQNKYIELMPVVNYETDILDTKSIIEQL